MSNNPMVYGIDPETDAKLRSMVTNPDVWQPGMTLNDAMYSGGVMKINLKKNNSIEVKPHKLTVSELSLEEIKCLD